MIEGRSSYLILGIPWPKHSCHDFTMNNASSSYEFYFVSKDYDIDYYSKKHLIIRSSHKTVEETIDRLAHKIASRLLFKLLKDERTKKYFSTIIMGIAPSELLSLKVLYSSPLMNFHVVEAHIGGRFHVQNGTVERKRIVHFIFNIDKRYYVICNSESASLLIKHIKQKIDWQLNSATYFQNLHGQKQLAQSRTSQKDSVARENVIKQLIKRYRSFINLQTLSEREIINIIEWLYDNDPDRFRNWAMKNKSSSFKFKSVVIEYVRKIYPK